MLIRNDDEGLTPEILALVKRKRTLEQQIKDERRLLEQTEAAYKYEQQVRTHTPLPSQRSTQATYV